ncbi:MAG: type IX secretion system membrane protein PorP/SprF [Crocinitomicaceae bacterium]|nr:type IX secretion system membrane protein PorP/SprF [Crocinitomicaceae bacterium]
MRISLFLLGLLIIGTTQAQQLPQFSQVALNRSLYNPAFIGDEQATILTLGGRWQMIGFGQEPQSAFLNFEKNLTMKPKPITKSSCDSPPLYRVMGYKSYGEWQDAGCPS